MQCTYCGKAIPEFKAWVVSPPRDHYGLFCSKACIGSFFAPDRRDHEVIKAGERGSPSPQDVVLRAFEEHWKKGESIVDCPDCAALFEEMAGRALR